MFCLSFKEKGWEGQRYVNYNYFQFKLFQLTDYNYGEIPSWKDEQLVHEEYVAPKQDDGLTNRLSALENWASSVDLQLKTFNQKLTKLDNLEAQIETYSLKHLQQNIIQILTVNSENGEAIAAKLKKHFDRDYMSKDDMERMSQKIYEKLINSWQPNMDEDNIRRIIQEYLAVFEREQMMVIIEKIREYVKEVRVQRVETGFDEDAVKRIVAAMLEIYDADKTGLVDYALESAGECNLAGGRLT